MIYKILRVWALLCIRFYFRRIYVTGRQNVPQKGTVLFIVNHPSSFMEACLLACFQHRDLHFLVRGDVFEKPWLKKILELTNQIPIYRFRDGYTKLKFNKSSFLHSFKVLSKQKALLIFPEASTLMVKHLRPLHKGAARLAIGSLEEGYCKELCVIPAGVYYEQVVKSRSDVVINMGKPISMVKWMEMNSAVEDKLSQLTSEFQNSMEDVMISLQHPEKEKLFNDLFDLLEPYYLKFSGSGYWNSEIGFRNMRKYEYDFDQLDQKSYKLISQHVQVLKKFNVPFKSIAANFNYSRGRKILLILKSIITFFLSLPGVIVYSSALFFPNSFVKSKVKHVEFHSPIRVAFFMVLHLLISILLWVVLSINFGWLYSSFALVILQFSLYFFCQFIDVSRYSKLFFRSFGKDKLELMESELGEILQYFNLKTRR